MITPKISPLKEISIEENKKGNEVTLLAKANNDNYELKEHIGYVKSIGIYLDNPKMRRVTLAFKNMDLETVAYIDPDITEGELVSTVGFCYEFDNKPTYSCKGGICRIYESIEEIASTTILYRNKMYKMGITTGLSTIEVQEPYCTKPENIYPLGDNGIYYAIEKKGARDIIQGIYSMTRHQGNKMNIDDIPMEEQPQDNQNAEDEAMLQENTNKGKINPLDEFGNPKIVTL